MTGDNDTKKRQADARAARLEAQLRANLNKRKEQARARVRSDGAQPRDTKDGSPDGSGE